MKDKEFFSTAELAKILGVSRIAVYKRIKRGDIKATRVGRSFVVNKKDIKHLFSDEISTGEKKEIDAAVKKTVKEYGETLKMLGDK